MEPIRRQIQLQTLYARAWTHCVFIPVGIFLVGYLVADALHQGTPFYAGMIGAILYASKAKP